jgi:hypothetical protein
MKATIIKESIDGARRKEIYELYKTKQFTEPEIYVMRPTTDTLTIHGNKPLSDYIYEERIPEGFEVVRVESSMNSGVTYTDPSAVAIRIFIPNVNDLFKMKAVFSDAIINVLEKYGVEARFSTHRKGANDMVFIKDGIEKKFCGCVHDLKYSYVGFILTFNFDSTKINGLYKMDTLKMLRRGPVSDITEVVGGLHEVNPSMLPDVIADEIVALIVEKMNW